MKLSSKCASAAAAAMFCLQAAHAMPASGKLGLTLSESDYNPSVPVTMREAQTDARFRRQTEHNIAFIQHSELCMMANNLMAAKAGRTAEMKTSMITSPNPDDPWVRLEWGYPNSGKYMIHAIAGQQASYACGFLTVSSNSAGDLEQRTILQRDAAHDVYRELSTNNALLKKLDENPEAYKELLDRTDVLLQRRDNARKMRNGIRRLSMQKGPTFIKYGLGAER